MATTSTADNACRVGPYDDVVPHSCLHCQTIAIKPSCQLDIGDWSIPIRCSRKQARHAASERCPLFQLLLPVYSFRTYWKFASQTAYFLIRPESTGSEDGRLRGLQLRLQRFWRSLINPTIEIYIRAKWKTNKITIRFLDTVLENELCAFVLDGQWL